LCIQAKLQFQTILDQVFPEFRGVFGDLCSKVSLNLLSEFPTAESVLAVTEPELTDKIEPLCPSCSTRWVADKAKKIVEAAIRNPFQRTNLQSHLFNLEMYIKMLLQYQEHLSALENKIDALAMEIEEYQIIQSVPGIGGKIAATILPKSGK
jgi:transposase